MAEKTTKGTTELNQGLNEGNPNTERTPVGNDRVEGITGGVNQRNYTDEQQGEVPEDIKNREEGANKD